MAESRISAASLPCKIEGCTKIVGPKGAKGMCPEHYQRVKARGNPDRIKIRKTCSVDGCDSPAQGRGYCKTHWARWKRHGTAEPEVKVRLCSVEGCGEKHYGNDLCRVHYMENRQKSAKPCLVDGCDQPSLTRGWCSKHYQHWAKYGCTEATRNDAKGFLEGMLHRFRTEDIGDECIEWPFATVNGYGVVNSVKYGDGGTVLVTRIVCSEINGDPAVDTLFCCHGCGNPACINPRHLRWDTQEGNMADTVTHGTRLRGEDVAVSKLTEQQAREVKALKGKLKVDVVAEKFGVSRWTIYDVWNGRSWGWI